MLILETSSIVNFTLDLQITELMSSLFNGNNLN